MATKNKKCWEYMSCGRQPGGEKTAEFGECVAAHESRLDGVHGGKNGGRACWILKNTLCGGNVQSNLAVKLGKCTTCEFYKHVLESEDTHTSSKLREMLK